MTSRPRLTEHQLNRRLLWTRVWLVMALISWPRHALLADIVIPLWRARLREMRDLCLRLIFLKAIARVAHLHRFARHHGPPLGRRAGAMRAAYGVRLLQALRGRGLREQFEALLHVVRNVETFIARLARRLRKALRTPLRFKAVRAIALADQRISAPHAALNTSYKSKPLMIFTHGAHRARERNAWRITLDVIPGPPLGGTRNPGDWVEASVSNRYREAPGFRVRAACAPE